MNARQQAFVVAYSSSGNATESAIKAGYSKKTAYSNGQRLLKKAEIASALAELTAKKMAPIIATAEDRQKFWTDVMNNPDFALKDRLKASELLGKRHGDFLERREIVGSIVIERSYGL